MSWSPWSNPPSGRESATYNNPTITGAADFTSATRLNGLWRDLAHSTVPLIGLSSGSVSAAGAISGITALPVAYPHAFCYFPANIVATVAAAGWRYCTFSTTTAGTVFLDTWTPATALPTVPASPAPVVDGKGAFTGDTTEQGAIIPIAAGALGPNGNLEVYARIANNNSAGTKTLRVRLGGAAGTVYGSIANTTVVSGMTEAFFGNAGVAAVQNGYNRTLSNTAMTLQGAVTTSTVDTASATDVRITAQRNTATDNTVIERFHVKLAYGA